MRVENQAKMDAVAAALSMYLWLHANIGDTSTRAL